MLNSNQSVYFQTTVSESNGQTLPKQYINFFKKTARCIVLGKNDDLVVRIKDFMDIKYSPVFNTEEECGQMKKTILS